MKSKLEMAPTENIALKELSIIFYKLKTILDSGHLSYDDYCINEVLGSYFNTFNILVRKFWQDFGLEGKWFFNSELNFGACLNNSMFQMCKQKVWRN